MTLSLTGSIGSVAIAAEKAKKEWGCKKVLIFDWDVHHGNGIQHIFYEDPSVLYISIHRGGMDQSFFYPTTGTAGEVGKGEGRGFNVNIPVEFPGVGDPVYSVAMERIVLPIAHAFKVIRSSPLRLDDSLRLQPDIVIVSAGYDAAGGDPLGGMNVSPAMFRKMTKQMMEVANQHCDGKIVLALEVPSCCNSLPPRHGDHSHRVRREVTMSMSLRTVRSNASR